jgi:hypothetical protein
MKKLMIYIIVLLCSIDVYGQFECSTITDILKSSRPIDVTNYIPDNNTPIKYIRVNIHYMLRSLGDALYPGNFTPTGDGIGNSYNGYQYANELIATANNRLSSNSQMRLPPNNTTSIRPRKYIYVLNGVFFHENNSFYYYPSYPDATYRENTKEAINIYLNNTNGRIGGGHADMSNIRWVEIKGTWESYRANINNGKGLWVNAGIVNHEIGHNLSLFHTVLTLDGYCSDIEEDYCSDTPTRKEMKDNYNIEACCGWNCSTGTNNVMDYSGEDAISPVQLGRVHWTIENEIQAYKTCFFTNNTVNITSFTANKAYIGENVLIPSGSSILVNNNRALFINCKEFTINGAFELQVGSTLIVNTLNKCN